MNSTVEPKGGSTPATFPLPVCYPVGPPQRLLSQRCEQIYDSLEGSYFLLGHGSKTVGCWITSSKECPRLMYTLPKSNGEPPNEQEGTCGDSDERSDSGV